MEVRIDAKHIVDAQSFHTVFANAFGFPDFYGRNMNAWIDCMTYLDDPDASLSKVRVTNGDVLSLVIENAAEFKARCPKEFSALLECSAFVNWRRIEQGGSPILAVSIDA